MTEYLAYFWGEAGCANRYVRAANPKRALILARRIFEDDPDSFEFEPPVDAKLLDEIVIYDSNGNRLEVWCDDECRLRYAAPRLLKAAERVLARWAQGDLAEAVRGLGAAVRLAKSNACAVPHGQPFPFSSRKEFAVPSHEVVSKSRNRRYAVTFTDWTAYRLEIEAESAEQAIELAQGKSTNELWELAECRDGGQENWDAVELPSGVAAITKSNAD